MVHSSHVGKIIFENLNTTKIVERIGSHTQAFTDSTQNKSDNMILQNENAGLLVYEGKN